jgi:hypothetical protein
MVGSILYYENDDVNVCLFKLGNFTSNFLFQLLYNAAIIVPEWAHVSRISSKNSITARWRAVLGDFGEAGIKPKDIRVCASDLHPQNFTLMRAESNVLDIWCRLILDF